MSGINPKVLEKFIELNAPMHKAMDEMREFVIDQKKIKGAGEQNKHTSKMKENKTRN